MSDIRPSYRRVLKLLNRGYVLYQINTERYPDDAFLDWGPVTDVGPTGGPHPDKVPVSRPMFAALKDAGLVAATRRERIGDQEDATWTLTDAGRLAVAS